MKIIQCNVQNEKVKCCYCKWKLSTFNEGRLRHNPMRLQLCLLHNMYSMSGTESKLKFIGDPFIELNFLVI